MGKGMPAQLKRAALSVLGITVGRAGARRRHSEQQPPRRAHRLGAVFPGGARRPSLPYASAGAPPAPQNENKETYLPDILAESAVPPEDADVTAQGYRGHTRYDRPQMTIHPSHPISPNLTVAMPDSDSPIRIFVYRYSAVSSAGAGGCIACVPWREREVAHDHQKMGPFPQPLPAYPRAHAPCVSDALTPPGYLGGR